MFIAAHMVELSLVSMIRRITGSGKCVASRVREWRSGLGPPGRPVVCSHNLADCGRTCRPRRGAVSLIMTPSPLDDNAMLPPAPATM